MQSPIFHLFETAPVIELSSGDTLFRAGQGVTRMFLVRDGRIHLRRHTGEGAMLVLQNAGPGAVLAEASAYARHYHCDAVAARAASVAALSRSVFLDAFRRDEAVAMAWASMLARSVQAARMRAEIRSLPKVSSRLTAWLEEGNALPGPGHLQEVAAELGVTREAFYRELARRRALAGAGAMPAGERTAGPTGEGITASCPSAPGLSDNRSPARAAAEPASGRAKGRAAS